jgi:predicted dienelactone hydrolase
MGSQDGLMPSTTTLRRGLAVVVGSLAVAAAAPHAAAAETIPYLPAPTGSHPVGTTSLHLKDTSRQDPWVPSAGSRELMVSLWFPATSRGKDRAQYMTSTESELVLQGFHITDVDPDVLSKTRTNAYTDVTPAGRKHSLPLVVLSPGFTAPRTSLTAQAEELASHGYVVAAIDHTYENFAETFPDGRVTTCAACTLDVDDFPTLAIESRARDVSFVLDQLTGPTPKWAGSSLIDRTRIGMAGHSLGGASVGETMLTDPRVLAGADMDGTMFKPLPETGLARPFLLFGEEAQDPTWDSNWQLMTGWKRWLKVTGSVHQSFSDYDLLAQQIGVDLGSKLAGTRSVEIARRYIRAFFDLHLRGEPQPLLDKLSPCYPEVQFRES